jgi:hypothetical protein
MLTGRRCSIGEAQRCSATLARLGRGSNYYRARIERERERERERENPSLDASPGQLGIRGGRRKVEEMDRAAPFLAWRMYATARC